MGKNRAPLLAGLFLYSYEAEFIQKLLDEKKKNLLLWTSIRHFDVSTIFYLLTTINFTHTLIYPNELEIKDTTDCSASALYLDMLLKLNTNGKLTTQLYDKRDDFNFSIVNFPFLCSNIPISPVYGVFISRS
jgi:hypothetical protein